MNEASIPPPSYKIVLLGDSSVGKTSLVHRFTNNRFDNDIPNTIGAAFITKEHRTSNDRLIKFEIWDTAGQERYRSLTPMYYRHAKLALICFDISDLSSFDRAQYWIDQLDLVKDTEEIAIKLVGNKCDLVSQESLDLTPITEYIGQKKLPFYKTSAKSGEGIEQLFDDIANEIDDEFFDKYYESRAVEPEPRSSILLSNPLSQSGNCC